MLKLKLQYFGQLMWRSNSLAKTLMLRKIEGKRRRGQQKMRWLDGMINSMDMNLSNLREIVMDRDAWCPAVHGITKSQTWLSDWTTTEDGKAAIWKELGALSQPGENHLTARITWLGWLDEGQIQFCCKQNWKPLKLGFISAVGIFLTQCYVGESNDFPRAPSRGTSRATPHRD